MQKSLLSFFNILILLFLSYVIFNLILSVSNLKDNEQENQQLSKLNSEILDLESSISYYDIWQRFSNFPEALKEAAQPTVKRNLSIDVKEIPPALAELENRLEKKEAESFIIKKRMLKANRHVYIPIILVAFFTAFILLILALLPLFSNNIRNILLLLTIIIYLIGEYALASNSGNYAISFWRICFMFAYINTRSLKSQH